MGFRCERTGDKTLRYIEKKCSMDTCEKVNVAYGGKTFERSVRLFICGINRSVPQGNA